MRPKRGTLRLVYVFDDGVAMSRCHPNAELILRRYEELKKVADIHYCAIFEVGKKGPQKEWHSKRGNKSSE